MIWGHDKVNIKKLNIGIPQIQEYTIYAISYGKDLIIIPIAEYIIKHNNADGFSFLSLRRRYYLDKYPNIQHINGLYDDISDYIRNNNQDIINIAEEFGIYDEDITVYVITKNDNQLLEIDNRKIEFVGEIQYENRKR